MRPRNGSKFWILALIITIGITLTSVSAGFAQVAGCQDAAGGPIPCTPTPAPQDTAPDRDGDGIPDVHDACPDAFGMLENNGCATAVATPTIEPTASTANPLRPPADGACRVSALTTFGTNVRAEPSLNAQQVALLDPLQLYDVLNIVVNGEGTWYRVEAGWVNSSAVALGGDCPVRVAFAGPTGFSIPEADYDQTMAASIVPENECFVIFNGMRLCQVVLTASADDGSTEGTVPWNVTTCGFGPGGVVCILNELTAFTEDECLPEFCEPPPSPLPPGWPNPNGEGQIGSCDALLNDLAASSETPHYLAYGENGDLSVGLRLPPVDPQPCQHNVFVVREDQAANGRLPVDKLTLEIDLPEGDGTIEIVSWSLGEGSSTQMGHVKVFNGNSGGEFGGDVCIAMVAGDFTHCPTEPVAPTDFAIAPTPVPPLSVLDRLSSVPTDPGTGYTCQSDSEDHLCYCQGGDDCADLFLNACFGEEMLCQGDICGCAYPNEPD